VLFQNVRIFDGRSDGLSAPSHVLVRDNRIEKISTAPIPVDAARTITLSGEGRVLMPGLIDAHWHAMLIRVIPATALSNDVGYNNLLAAAEASAEFAVRRCAFAARHTRRLEPVSPRCHAA